MQSTIEAGSEKMFHIKRFVVPPPVVFRPKPLNEIFTLSVIKANWKSSCRSLRQPPSSQCQLIETQQHSEIESTSTNNNRGSNNLLKRIEPPRNRMWRVKETSRTTEKLSHGQINFYWNLMGGCEENTGRVKIKLD